MKTAIELIQDERSRLGEFLDKIHNGDLVYDVGTDLSVAAACYAAPEYTDSFDWPRSRILPLWPWDGSAWEPTPNDRQRELVKAGALIVAEIERLQRIEKREKKQ